MSADEHRFARHAEEWRDPLTIAAQWSEFAPVDAGMFEFTSTGRFWDVLEQLAVTIIVTREYEHLVLAVSCSDGVPRVSYMRVPHPSGLAFDTTAGILHLASTRNPNQVYSLAPVTGTLERRDNEAADIAYRPLVPVATRYLPGCFYIHDLACIGSVLHANSVGQNAVVRIDGERGAAIAWWPKSVERDGVPDTGQNLIQLNSIAAGPTLDTSFFSASGAEPAAFPPGHLEYPVDRLGVVFAGATGEPMMRGLTRPHSARLHDGRVWVDNSGYGELAVAAEANGYDVVARLPGWTRGLTFVDNIAFAGTSRVIPRFRHYAPGLDVDSSRCAVHAVDCAAGTLLGSLEFPTGNQLFAIEAVPSSWTGGFPFQVDKRNLIAERRLFYAYRTERDR